MFISYYISHCHCYLHPIIAEATLILSISYLSLCFCIGHMVLSFHSISVQGKLDYYLKNHPMSAEDATLIRPLNVYRCEGKVHYQHYL